MRVGQRKKSEFHPIPPPPHTHTHTQTDLMLQNNLKELLGNFIEKKLPGCSLRSKRFHMLCAKDFPYVRMSLPLFACVKVGASKKMERSGEGRGRIVWFACKRFLPLPSPLAFCSRPNLRAPFTNTNTHKSKRKRLLRRLSRVRLHK